MPLSVSVVVRLQVLVMPLAVVVPQSEQRVAHSVQVVTQGIQE
jgi:hypothetical protein